MLGDTLHTDCRDMVEWRSPGNDVEKQKVGLGSTLGPSTSWHALGGDPGFILSTTRKTSHDGRALAILRRGNLNDQRTSELDVISEKTLEKRVTTRIY